MTPDERDFFDYPHDAATPFAPESPYLADVPGAPVGAGADAHAGVGPDPDLWREARDVLMARFGWDEATANTAAWSVLAAAGRVLAERLRADARENAAGATGDTFAAGWVVALNNAAAGIERLCGAP